MNFKIYQINKDRDLNGVAFLGLDRIGRFQASADVDSSIYDQVYAGSIDGGSLEKLYNVFNTQHPADYKGRSMSVSDIVEIEPGSDIEPGFYFCDSFGFKKVDFEPEKSGNLEQKLTVVLLEPGKRARVEQIGASLEDMQAVVGGYIEAVYPFEEQVCMVCNEEGKLAGLPLNRAIYDPDSRDMTDIIAGTAFICDCSGENFGSLNNEQQSKYLAQFRYPEEFFRINGQIKAVPVKNIEHER